jgi:hypothetical protein
MAFLVLGANSVSGYTVKNSLRFNGGSSDYLNRTPASAGSRTAWTWSSWVKRSELATGSAQVLFGAYLTGSDSGWLEFGFDSDNTANWTVQNVGGNSTSVYRDVSAWYHYLMNYDGTASGLKLYINGSQVTISNTSSISGSLGINSASSHRIGRSPNTAVSRQFGGYLADTYFIDGSTLTPSSFGETDFDTGIWKPKAFSGTYGTNGFYLQFKNSASLGTDSSGNGNTFTVNNLTSVDQSTDTPTNNFSTMNPLDNSYASSTFSEGNLRIVTSSGNYTWNTSSVGASVGKWYCEVKIVSAVPSANQQMIGISNTTSTSTTANLGSGIYGWGYHGNGTVYNNGSSSAYGNTFTTNDIISIALDLDNNKLYFAKNGTYQNSGVPTSGATGTGALSITASSSNGTGNYFIACGDYDNAGGCTLDINFGSPNYSANSYTDGAGKGNFSYSVPSGYFALCTANLSLYG